MTTNLIAFLLVISIVCGILVLAEVLTKRTMKAGDWFRARWGGSDARYMKGDDDGTV